MRIRIGICDDDSKDLEYVKSLVTKYDPSFELFEFQSAENLLRSIKKQQLDIIFLDIRMDGINGFQAAKKLSETHHPPLIIFVTNSIKHSFRGYEVSAFRYLPKPIDYEMFANYLSAAIAKIIPQKIPISVDSKTHIISVFDIIYVESSGHNLIIYTTKEKFISRMRLIDAEAILPKNLFAKPHKSYLVNLGFVYIIETEEVVLASKQKIPLARGRKGDFERALDTFVRSTL